MKPKLLEADFALSLPHVEAEKPELSMHWTGWKKHQWPANEIEPGVRFYVFDLKSRRYCALLEVTKGGGFNYRTRSEFERQVKKLTGWWPSHEVPHWSRIPSGERGRLYTGFAIRWKVIKRVDIPGDHRFPQIGWERLADSIAEELDEFESKNRHLKETTRKQLIDSRLGQGKFREDVLSFWRSGCAVTGCKTRKVLRASHIKPWAESNNRERLDPFNGLALIPNLDVAFDRGLISFQDDGRILISPNMDHRTRTTLGISSKMRVKRFKARHFPYLKYHRRKWGHEEGGS
jgi:HNH endonuclease